MRFTVRLRLEPEPSTHSEAIGLAGKSSGLFLAQQLNYSVVTVRSGPFQS
jgi:hypothetical protein